MKHMDNFKLKMLYYSFIIKHFNISWEEQMLCHPVKFDGFSCWKEINSLNVNLEHNKNQTPSNTQQAVLTCL